jgi:anti-sigma28 factor (negative regulator of flagellin synthesis)
MRDTDDDDARFKELQAAIEDGTYECSSEGIAAAILARGDLFEDNDEWLA